MILDDLAAHLDPLITGTVGTALMPDDPDRYTVVSEYALGAPEPHDAHRYIGIQVRARALRYDDARAAAQAAYTALHKVAETPIGSTYVNSILAQQEPFPVGYDGKRWVFAVNFRALV